MSRPLTAAAPSVALLLLKGCAGLPPVDPATAGNHPANSDAPTAPFPPPSQTLAILDDAGSAPLPTDRHTHVGPGDNDDLVPLPGEPARDTSNGMGGMKMEGMSHGSQDAVPAPATQPAATQPAAPYACPMHPEVRADEPGRCPICGMTLVKKEGGAE